MIMVLDMCGEDVVGTRRRSSRVVLIVMTATITPNKHATEIGDINKLHNKRIQFTKHVLKNSTFRTKEWVEMHSCFWKNTTRKHENKVADTAGPTSTVNYCRSNQHDERKITRSVIEALAMSPWQPQPPDPP